MNKKKIGWIILIISLFGIFTTSTLVMIGSFSSYLITDFRRRIALTILIISSCSMGYGIFLLYKYRKKDSFKRWIKVVTSIFISLYAVGCFSFLFLLYGPISNFRDWLITTAMATMNHQYYCKWFYSEDTIKEVLGDNYILENDEETDTSLINKDNDISYDNKYEKEILDRDENDVFKIINFKVNGCDAYLAAIYDASKISVGVTKYLGVGGQYATTIAKDNGAGLAINGGGFFDPNYNSNGGTPLGVTIANGKVITNNENGTSATGGVIGFNKDNILVLSKGKDAHSLINEGIRDAVTMGPFLIVNGSSSFIKGNGGWGYAARTAIGQRADGIVLFLVVDSNEFRTKGASMRDLTEIMQNYGAINAANLDGGTSSVMVVNGGLINDPIDSTLAHKTRGIPTIFMVKE